MLTTSKKVSSKTQDDKSSHCKTGQSGLTNVNSNNLNTGANHA